MRGRPGITVTLALLVLASGCGDGENSPRRATDGRQPDARQAELTGRIAFETDRDGNYEIYTMDPDGTSLDRLTDDTAADEEPVFSPDGSRIAFASDRDGNEEIYLLDPGGGRLVNITTDPGEDSDSHWVPGR